MRRLSNLLLAVCILGVILGLAGVINDMVSGFALAIGAVMFILSFNTRVIEKAEATH